MDRFFVTFGAQYSRQEHPRFSLAHPDGWVTIMAPGYGSARAFAVVIFGTAWCDIYDEDNFEGAQQYFPRGEIARFTLEETADGAQEDV